MTRMLCGRVLIRQHRCLRQNNISDKMKQNRLLTLAVLSLLGASCTREFAEPEGGPDVREVEIGVSLPDASVRTALGPKGENSYQTLWVEGDRLSLNDGKSQTTAAGFP